MREHGWKEEGEEEDEDEDEAVEMEVEERLMIIGFPRTADEERLPVASSS